MLDLEKVGVMRKLGSFLEEMEAIAEHIRRKAQHGQPLEILEAGCGRRWRIDLGDVAFRLTGIDSDRHALEMREKETRDLAAAILGDLRTIRLEEDKYDVVFCSDVLEHVEGAEEVLDRFCCWLKPGGLMVLVIPNRDSAKGFLTRVTPLWLHILFKKYFMGYRQAGKPGYGPFATPFDRVVSRSGIRDYCEKRVLTIVAEYGSGLGRKIAPLFRFFSNLLLWVVHAASFRRLSVDYSDLIYIIECKE